MRTVRPSGLPVTVLVAAALLVAPGRAPRAQQPDTAAGFDMQEVMIPTRDGVRLHTTIFVPRGAHEALPFILTRTPYGIAHAAGSLSTYYRALAADGYVFVFQDIRGRYGSEGQFVMMRPPRDRRDSACEAYPLMLSSLC